MAKQLNLKLDPKSPEFRWAQAQSNKTLSLKHLIDLAIQNYGYEDLIKISLSQVAKTQKLSLGDITSSTSCLGSVKSLKSDFFRFDCASSDVVEDVISPKLNFWVLAT